MSPDGKQCIQANKLWYTVFWVACVAIITLLIIVGAVYSYFICQKRLAAGKLSESLEQPKNTNTGSLNTDRPNTERQMIPDKNAIKSAEKINEVEL